MKSTDERIDAYINRAPAFAKPILTHLRAIVHAACPDVVETIKWGTPHFEHHGPMCGMAAFNAHCGFGFWKSKLVLGGVAQGPSPSGQFGRITSVDDLPPKRTLLAYVKRAASLNERGVKEARAARTPKPAVKIPAEVLAALESNAKARATFDAFSPSHRREYIEWITEAKRPETRERRLKQTIAQLAAGKPHNWQYR